MNGVALWIAFASLGVLYDVQKSEDGKLEYVILIEPELLKSLSEGQEIHSSVPPEAGAVERVLIRIGDATPKHSQANVAEYLRLLVSASRTASTDRTRTPVDSTASIVWPAKTRPELNYNVTHGWQPDQAGSLAYYVQLDPTLLQTLAVGDEIRAGIDPAAGKVGRFIILSGNKQLPKIPVEPATGTTALADAAANRGKFQPTGIGAGGFGQATSTIPPSTIPPRAAPPAERPFTPLRSTPDYAAVTPSPAEQPLYAPRGPARYGGVSDQAADLRAPVLEAPAGASFAPSFGPSPATYGDNRTDQSRGYGQPAPVNYGPPNATLPRTAAEQPQPPRAAYAPPTNYAPPSTIDNRLASIDRGTTAAAAAPLPAPQINPTSTGKTATTAAQPEKPWVPLMFTAFALFMSIGGNLYLGWTAAEFYSRYRLATERLRSASRG